MKISKAKRKKSLVKNASICLGRREKQRKDIYTRKECLCQEDKH